MFNKVKIFISFLILSTTAAFSFICFSTTSVAHDSVTVVQPSVLSQKLFFEAADPSMRDFLVDFAIESNDIYKTRTASREVAQDVFAISDAVFEKGVVEVLKLDEEIVGFYTLKAHPPSNDWFEHELGHLFVKAGLQHKGYGTLIFKRAVSMARERKWDKIEWLCDPDAEIFYLKMGATITRHCENLLNPGVDLPIFEYVIK